MVEDHHALCPGLRLYQRFHLRIVDARDLVRVEEIAHRRVVAHEAEAVALEDETAGVRPAVVDRDAMRVGRAAAPHLGRSRPAAVGPRRRAGILEIIERRLDRVGGGVQFGNLGHGGPPVGNVHAQERFKPAWAPPQLDGILKYSPGKAAKCRTLRVFEIFFSALHAAPFRLLVTRFDLPAYINTDIAKTASTPD